MITAGDTPFSASSVPVDLREEYGCTASRIALPAVETTYTAEEVGRVHGISANMVGRIANKHGLKNEEFGMEVLDKAKNCAKEVPAWRYNAKGMQEIGK